MKDLMTTCVLRAHKAIRSNPLVLWFPILFSVTVGVFYILFFLIMMSPYLPTNAQVDAFVFSQEMVELALGRVIMLGLLAVILLILMTAGTLGLQAKAVKGESPETKDYFKSVRRFFFPVLGGQAVTAMAYLIPVAVLTLLFVTGPFFAGLEGQFITEAEFATVLSGMAPALFLGSLVFAALVVFFSMWAKVVALEQCSLGRALLVGFKFVWANRWFVIVLLGGSWLGTFIIRLMLEGSFVGSLLQMAVSFTVRSYVAMTLMHLYLIKTAES